MDNVNTSCVHDVRKVNVDFPIPTASLTLIGYGDKLSMVPFFLTEAAVITLTHGHFVESKHTHMHAPHAHTQALENQRVNHPCSSFSLVPIGINHIFQVMFGESRESESATDLRERNVRVGSKADG